MVVDVAATSVLRLGTDDPLTALCLPVESPAETGGFAVAPAGTLESAQAPMLSGVAGCHARQFGVIVIR